MAEWLPDLSKSDKPRYLAIADAIAEDVRIGRLTTGMRLPPQRRLASRLGLDFTTIARGYVEAQKRGLVESTVGQGTFVKAMTPAVVLPMRRRPEVADHTMNLPPEPTDPVLVDRMQAGLAEISRDLISLMRYQGFGGSEADKEAAASWLGRRAMVPSQERIFVTPGAHSALLGILSVLTRPGDTILSETLTYPGIRSLAAQMGLSIVGLPMNDEGIDPAALGKACVEHVPKALYLNPTLQNPTTLTVSERRRTEIAAVARRYGVPIIEDDAYGFIPRHSPAALAAIAPDITWHVAGLAKCLGAGLRVAYVVVPSPKAGWPFAAVMRAHTVMASPLSVALATRWIEDGTADALLHFIRAETAARQLTAAQILPPGSFRSDPLSFNLWVPLPDGWTRSAFSGHMRATGIGVAASDAFVTDGNPPEAVRVCLGGPISRSALEHGLEFMAHALSQSPAMASRLL